VLAVSLQIHRPAFLAKLSERDWQLLKFGADNIVRELAEEEFRGNPSLNWYILEYTDGLLVIVLFHRIREEETLYSAAERLSEKATEKIRTYLKIDAFAGIGTVRSSLAGLLDSFLESREVLETAEFQGAGQVYPFREWGRLRSGVDQYGPLLKCWNESLNLRDMEKARRSWERIREHLLRESPPSLSETQTICVGIMSSLMYFWNEQFPLIPPPHTMSRFLEEIQKYYTLADLVGWLDSWVGEWLRAGSQELFGKKGNRLVESVKQYVEEHYREDISFSAIARELFVHPKYLSQLFKRVTGENFVNYLNKFRIQKAIDYLQTGEHMVYEVSEMVGYKNPTYFSQVFKMITGKSPSEFIKP
jgi:AraC-like DNA-binding protein